MSVHSIQIRLIPTHQIQAPLAEALAAPDFGAPASAAEAPGRMTRNGGGVHRVRSLKRKAPEPAAAAGAGAGAGVAAAKAIPLSQGAAAAMAAVSDAYRQNGEHADSSAAHAHAACLGVVSCKAHVLKSAAAAADAASTDADPFGGMQAQGTTNPSSCAAHAYAALLGAVSHKSHVPKAAAAADPFESPIPEEGTVVAAAAAAVAATDPLRTQLTQAHGAGRAHPSSYGRRARFGVFSRRGPLPKEAL